MTIAAESSGTEVHVGIDVGGTFTDVAVNIPSQNRLIRYKLPSTPDRPDQAIVDGIAAVLSENGIESGDVIRLSHGTTVGTNALIQRRCGTVAVVTSDGFRDLLEIGRQTRPKVYDMHSDHPKPLVPRELRLEVPERILADGSVFRALDEAAVQETARHLAKQNVDCVVVCFLHSYAHPENEERAVDILKQNLPNHVTVLASSSVYPEFREYERFSTAVLNAALITVMNTYLDRFTESVKGLGIAALPKVSQSVGGLMSIDMARALPIRASLSGPAAGVIGSSYRARETNYLDIITLDVGGTSADVSLMREGVPSEVHERLLAGFPLRLPALDVNAVGAGGGSIAWIDRDGLLKVGPQSAGAHPGPACYALGGNDATVTDANVVLGRLNGEALLDGRMPIQRDLAVASIERLANELSLGVEETALGIIRVACATMVKAIRTISLERGLNPAEFSLFAFGGAGPLHGTEVAQDLDIRTIIVPPNPGILCAEGLLNSELTTDFVRTVFARLDDSETLATLNAMREELRGLTDAWFDAEDTPSDDRKLIWTAELRYVGQNYELPVSVEDAAFDAAASERIARDFFRVHEQHYGFAPDDEPVQFVNLRVKAISSLIHPALPVLERRDPAVPTEQRMVTFEKESAIETGVYRREALAPGQRIEGPAVIEQLDTTVIVHPQDVCTVDDWGNLVIELH